MSLKGFFRPAVGFASGFGRACIMFVTALHWAFRRPVRPRLILKQMGFISVKSLLVVIVTGVFTGMVLALQTYYALRRFNSETLVGANVMLNMTRELGPVLASLMVTAGAGSAMASEIGAMRVTEQTDAPAATAVDPVRDLVRPRMIASLVMLPILAIIADFAGILGGYLVGVDLFGINGVVFVSKIVKHLNPEDIYDGLAKAACFGLILAVTCCCKGFYAKGGAEGVEKATTEAVIASSMAILVADYILTSIMF